MTSSLSNRYYLGFSVGALMAQPSKFSFGDDEIPIEFDTGIAGGLEIGRKFDQWSFSFSYAYSQTSLLKRHGARGFGQLGAKIPSQKQVV